MAGAKQICDRSAKGVRPRLHKMTAKRDGQGRVFVSCERCGMCEIKPNKNK